MELHVNPETNHAMNHLYHYTRIIRLPSILQTSQIQQFSPCFNIHDCRPVVWLSSHPVWEPSASPMQADSSYLTFEQIAEIETPIRIEVNPAKYRFGWDEFVNMSGCEPFRVAALYDIATMMGAQVSQWRISFDPIPSGDWLGIEGYLGGQWEHLPESMFAEIADVRLTAPD